MAAPKVYKSTDANAPVLNGIYGSAIDVIRAVCVTGYGDKSPLGWSEEFSKTGVIVIRPGPESVGNRLLYRFEDANNIVYSPHAKFRVCTYESMSGVDSGSGATPVKHWYKSNVINAVAMPWMIIGDEAGFYFITNYTQGAPYNAYAELNYAGHGNRLFTDDEWFSIIAGFSETSLNYLSALPKLYNPEVATYGYSGINLSRKRSGDVGSIGALSALKYNGGIGCVSANATMGSTASIPASFNYPHNGKLLYAQPIVGDAGACGVRGYLPGLYSPQHSGGLTDRQIISQDGKMFLVIRICAGGITTATDYGWALIDIGEGFRP